ncbi:MAG: VirB3 family type IV secretion system protein [Aquabacterium sp.]|jgi:type IV secretory pathway TrbD component|nr:VirB3 family type IV secretion system protein [Aquabacterium sp.]
MDTRRSTIVRRSLLETKSTAGAEFAPTVLNITLMLVMMMGPKLLWWPLIALVLHSLLKWMFGRDDKLTLVFARYSREADVYDPWPRPRQVENKRPYGMGRDLPLA